MTGYNHVKIKARSLLIFVIIDLVQTFWLHSQKTIIEHNGGFTDVPTGTVGFTRGKNQEPFPPDKLYLPEHFKMRLWDISGGCYDQWRPWFISKTSNPYDGPVGVDEKFLAIYHSKQSDVEWAISEPNKYSGNPLDEMFFSGSVCLESSQAQDLIEETVGPGSEYGNCVQRCTEKGAYFALISKEDCCCGTDQDEIFHKEVVSADGYNSCKPCEDFPTQLCGGEEYFSVYQIKEKETNFKYWQTVSSHHLNDPKIIYSAAEELYYVTSDVNNCLDQCDNYQIAEVNHSYCRCLTHYKFRLEDIAKPQARYFWQPNVPGIYVYFNCLVIFSGSR